jgi:processive 1,2-diacylglycerol beta-glucosyltransferase
MEILMQRKRVLVLSTSVGAGHRSAALALEQAFRRFDDVEVEVQDVLDLTNETYKLFSADAYHAAVKQNPWLVGWLYDYNDQPFQNERPLRQLWDLLNAQPVVRFIREFDPQVAVCTHFTPAGILAYMISRENLGCSLSIVGTDYDFQGMWLSTTFSRYFVALDETKVHLEMLGIADDHITVSGIPVNLIFEAPFDRAATLARYRLRADLPLLLVSAGAVGGGPARDIVAQLMRMRQDAQAVIVCGKNEQLRRDVEAMTLEQAGRFRVLGFTDDMPNLIRAATLFVGKPGGLTSAECMAAGLPMVIVQPIPGQEERNSDHLLEAGAAVRCNDLTTVAFKLDRVLGEAGYLERLRAGARAIGRPGAARVIAETLRHDEAELTQFSQEQRRQIQRTARSMAPPPSLGTIAVYDEESGLLLGTLSKSELRRLGKLARDAREPATVRVVDASIVELLRAHQINPSLVEALASLLREREQVKLRRVRL